MVRVRIRIRVRVRGYSKVIPSFKKISMSSLHRVISPMVCTCFGAHISVKYAC